MADTPNVPAVVPVAEIRLMAEAVAKSGLFGVKTVEQAMALMLIAHAEGLHPAIAARDYDIIQGRPAKKSEAMLRSFLQLGGKVEWIELTDERVVATFSHPNGGSATIDWDMPRAKKAGLGGKDMWSKYPRQMLRARVISEGVRTVHPGATSGLYTPEEIHDFAPVKTRIQRLPAAEAEPIDAEVIEDQSPPAAPSAGPSLSGAAAGGALSDEELLKECGAMEPLKQVFAMLWADAHDNPSRRAKMKIIYDDCKLSIIEAERVAAQ